MLLYIYIDTHCKYLVTMEEVCSYFWTANTVWSFHLKSIFAVEQANILESFTEMIMGT